MQPHRKGDLTESIVITEFKRRGIPVSIPFGDNERYDVVVETLAGDLLRVQIKTGWMKDGVVQFHARTQHTNSQGNVYKPYEHDVDYFVVYVHELEGMYLIAEDDFNRSIKLRVEEPKQRHENINWAEEYEFDRRWPPSSSRATGTVGGDPLVKRTVQSLEHAGADVYLPRRRDRGRVLVAIDSGVAHLIRIMPVSITKGGFQLNPDDDDFVDCYIVAAGQDYPLYVIDADGFDSTITLRLDPPKRHQPSIKYAEEFTFENNWPPRKLRDPLNGAGEQTKRTLQALEDGESTVSFEEDGSTIPTLVADVGDHCYRIRAERGWRQNGCLCFQPSDGEYDWYTVLDPEDEVLYLVDANDAGSSVELRLEEPKHWDPKIKMAEDYRFVDNWSPEPE